jgi:3-isopropylmalate/(R)-2-methylmalate dehydratase small subunit
MKQFTALSSKIVSLPINDIDTDQIIPARFLKGTDKHGLGEKLFADWRYTSDGTPNPDFVLNQPENQGAQILLAGDNFGCGSSREHAPWALVSFGFRAVISTSFADIFYNNALKNALLPVKVDDATHKKLFQLQAEQPDKIISIDLANQTLELPDGTSVTFPVNAFSKKCLLNGMDEMDYILSFSDEILQYEQNHTIT